MHVEECLFKLIPLFLFFRTDFWCWLQGGANPRKFGAHFSSSGYYPNGEHMDMDFVSVLLLAQDFPCTEQWRGKPLADSDTNNT